MTGAAQRLQRWGYKSRRAKRAGKFFVVVPPKRGYKYHFAPSNRGYKIIAKITRRLVQKCNTWFRSTNFTSCSPQSHCTVIFYYGTRYWPISRFMFFMYRTVRRITYTSQIMAHRRTLTSDPVLLLHVLNNK